MNLLWETETKKFKKLRHKPLHPCKFCITITAEISLAEAPKAAK